LSLPSWTSGALRWLGLALIALVLSWAALSRWYSVRWMSPRTDAGNQVLIRSSHGRLSVSYTHMALHTRTYFPNGLSQNTDPHWRWWFHVTDDPGLKIIAIPLWCFVVVIAVPTVALWHAGFDPPAH
jgi:hypothetical protein